jgi:RHS repeat-associated protein
MGARSRCRSGQSLNRCFHRNQQYSITSITDASAAVVERYVYSAYGTPTITDESGTTRTATAIGNRHSYTGREWGETLAMYHYRARMYDSVGGRFISRDPIRYVDGKNLYLRKSPLHSTDPTGRITSTAVNETKV